MIKGWKSLKFWKQTWPSLSNYLLDVESLPKKGTFKALELTPFEEVKCVILGQDPYHTPNTAMGLAFSVLPHVSPLPPSLRNIIAEYRNDLGHPNPSCGDLTPWAEAGVLLLNTILTVEEGRPLSHAGLGWEKLSYEIIRKLSEEREHIVFMLWGKKAQEYIGAIDERRHHVITSPHPSPYSASSGFLGSRPFTRCNEYLRSVGKKPLDWKLR